MQGPRRGMGDVRFTPKSGQTSRGPGMSALCQKRNALQQFSYSITSSARPRANGRKASPAAACATARRALHRVGSALLADASRLHESARGEKQKNEGERLNRMIKGVVVKVDGMQVDPDLLDRGGDECQHHSGEPGEKKTGLFAPVGEGRRNQQEGRRRQIVNDRDREGLADEENDCDVAD